MINIQNCGMSELKNYRKIKRKEKSYATEYN